MPKEHTVKAFTQELDLLKSKVLEMAEECERQLAKAVHSLVERDTKLAQDTIEGDTRINGLQGEVDELAIRMLALRQPMALDLRHIIAAQKMAADFERIADYAANIAKHAIELKNGWLDKPVKSIVKMADCALHMLNDIIDAYRDLDIDKAVAVWHQDDEIDKTYFGLLTKLRTLMIEDSTNVTASTRLLFVGRCCERIGDHITNVAENVHFIISGEMHHGRAIA
ncbi:MAG: phosphate signaling complex protein PhoU [Syntrophobacterales bacterium]|jgi:phosphate transport system protein